MGSKFTQKAELALNKSVIIAEDFGHAYIGTEHILLAMVEDETSCASILMKKNGLQYNNLYEAIKSYSGIGDKTHLSSKDTTPRCRRILENSYKNAKKFSAEKIGTEHLLLAIVDERDAVALKIMQKMAIDYLSLRDDILVFLKSNERILNAKKSVANATLIHLDKYGNNMNQKAKDDKYDPVIGREKEIDRIIRILARKYKNNPCLIGEAGVGKTAIVEGLASRIITGTAPDFLLGKIIYALDLTSMIAGAKYRGDFEERIKNIFDEVKSNPNIILFIDEIHSIVGAGSAEGAIDAANIMKPELARGDVQIIGATTLSEYKRFIEKDKALERRFQPITIDEPSKERTIDILKGLRSRYENHHNVLIEDSAIETAVNLSTRYINDRFLPDKAIDILDEACAKARISTKNIRFTEKYDNNLRHFDNIDVINGVVPQIFTDEDCGIGTFIKNDVTKPIVNSNNVTDVVEEITGINISHEITASLPDILFEQLSSCVIGQESAINALVSNIVRNSVGITNPCKPKGIFLFIGKSGVGKTMMAKSLAKTLFDSEDSIIRLDMSEYSESYSTSKLIGSAPGYVGYEESVSVFEKIRKSPYSIILLDEIEKAHPDVLALFLQIFDYGHIKDSSGRNIDFRNAYIIMTSNVGADWDKDIDIGFLSDGKTIDYTYKLKSHFSTEFIDRIDSIIRFNPLNMQDFKIIARRKINLLLERIKKYPISVDIGDDVIDYIANEAYKRKLGARLINRIIADKLEFPISKLIIEGLDDESYDIKICVEDKDIKMVKVYEQLQT